MPIEMLSILTDSRRFEPVGCGLSNPFFARLSNSDTLVYGRVNALLNFNFGLIEVRLCFSLSLERLDVPLAVLVEVIGLPGGFRLVLARRPGNFKYCASHWTFSDMSGG